MEDRSSDGNAHPFHVAPPNPGQFILVTSPNLELQEENYLGNNEEPSSLDCFPSPTLELVTREPDQPFRQAEMMSTQPTQPPTSLHQGGLLDGGNTSGEQAWKIGGNHSDQSWPIPWPQTPFPYSEMGLGVGHEAPHLTHQQEENQVICDQTNPYEASSGSHQFIDELSMIPFVLDAQYSSSGTPQQALPIWPHGMSQQQINEVLVDASDARIPAAVDISTLSPETSIPYRKSLYRAQHVQPNQLPILDADLQSHDSTMPETLMMIGPQYSPSYEQLNEAPFVQSFVNDADNGIMFSHPASSLPQSPLGFSNEAPQVIPNLNPGQSQFMNPEMMDGITEEQSQPGANFGPANTSFQPQSSGGIMNSVYDPMYETLGLPIDPHLRMFLASQRGPSRSTKNARR